MKIIVGLDGDVKKSLTSLIGYNNVLNGEKTTLCSCDIGTNKNALSKYQ